jgi:hypothetical protein
LNRPDAASRCASSSKGFEHSDGYGNQGSKISRDEFYLYSDIEVDVEVDFYVSLESAIGVLMPFDDVLPLAEAAHIQQEQFAESIQTGIVLRRFQSCNGIGESL